MALCTLYHDAKDRIYYLPETTVDDFKRDSRQHVSPQGCRKHLTLEGRAIYVLKDHRYPPVVIEVFKRMSVLSEEEACAELVSLNCTALNDSFFQFSVWFLKHNDSEVFKTAVSESAFFSREYDLLALTMPGSKFVPYKEDVVRVMIEGRQDIVNLLMKHVPIDRMTLIEGSLYANNKTFFDKLASDAKREEKDMVEFFMKVLELGRVERHYELAKRWVFSQSYSLSHPMELP